MGAPLITLAEYKTYKKLSKTDADLEIQLIVDSVNSLVKTYLGHSVIDYYTNPVVETFNVKDSQSTLHLNEWPVVEVVSVQARASYTETYSTVDPVEYYVDQSIDCIFKHGSAYWPVGYGAIKVTYKAGYSETPEDIKIACLDLVHHYYKEEYKDRKQIGNASIDNTSKSTAVGSEWPNHIVRVLGLYRNV